MYLALVAVAIISGTLASHLYDDSAPFGARLCAGAATGFAFLGLLGFVIASVNGLNPISLWITAGTLIILSALVLRDPARRSRIAADLSRTAAGLRRAAQHPTRWDIIYLSFYALVAALLWLVFQRVMFYEPTGVYTGELNNYGDLPFHLSVITSFARGQNFPPEDPTYAGVRFTYPFLVDFIAACFVTGGATLRRALLIENFVLAMAFVGVLHRWALVLCRDRVAGLITPVLVLFSGGFGWVKFLSDAGWSAHRALDLLWQLPPHEYTIIPDSTWRWGNAVTTLLVPQRSLLLGLPLVIVVFTEWWLATTDPGSAATRPDELVLKPKKKKRRRATSGQSPFVRAPNGIPENERGVRHMIAAGVVAGMLPLAHAHSFIVVIAMGGCLALLGDRWSIPGALVDGKLDEYFAVSRERLRSWAVFFGLALLIAIPQMIWATHGSPVKASSFIAWSFGWDHDGEDVFTFWLKNTGLLIPVVIAALAWRGTKRPLLQDRLVLFYLPFLLCFLIPNVVRLAPWIWDNIKVLFYWYIASAPIVAIVIATLVRRDRRLVVRSAGVALFLSFVLAGALDIWRIASKGAEYQEFDNDGLRIAQVIQQQTPPRALILHAPIHNHPVFLTGRRSLMGYPGHIWTHGLDYATREAQIRTIYSGMPDAMTLITANKVEYIVVSPLERSVVTVNDGFFARFQKIGEAGEYRLYKVSRE